MTTNIEGQAHADENAAEQTHVEAQESRPLANAGGMVLRDRRKTVRAAMRAQAANLRDSAATDLARAEQVRELTGHAKGLVDAIRVALTDASTRHFEAGDRINELLAMDDLSETRKPTKYTLRELAIFLNLWTSSFLSKLSTVAREFTPNERVDAVAAGATWYDCYSTLRLRKVYDITDEPVMCSLARYLQEKNRAVTLKRADDPRPFSGDEVDREAAKALPGRKKGEVPADLERVGRATMQLLEDLDGLDSRLRKVGDQNYCVLAVRPGCQDHPGLRWKLAGDTAELREQMIAHAIVSLVLLIEPERIEPAVSSIAEKVREAKAAEVEAQAAEQELRDAGHTAYKTLSGQDYHLRIMAELKGIAQKYRSSRAAIMRNVESVAVEAQDDVPVNPAP